MTKEWQNEPPMAVSDTSGYVEPLRIVADDLEFHSEHALWIGNSLVETRLQFRERDQVVRSRPTLTLPAMGRGPFQGLMDSLWNMGYRPSGELDSIGQRDAMKSHLADLRRVAFHALGIGDK